MQEESNNVEMNATQLQGEASEKQTINSMQNTQQHLMLSQNVDDEEKQSTQNKIKLRLLTRQFYVDDDEKKALLKLQEDRREQQILE